MPLLSMLVPSSVAVREAFDDNDDPGLYPAERALVENAVAKRQREFGTARLCARRALADLGLPAAPILTGLRGSPSWPDDVVGSLTHCDGYRAAALARRTDARSIGIDAEPHAELPEGVLDLISLPAERKLLATLTAENPHMHWDRLLFCAKESTYKAWFPLTERWLDFGEAEITIEPNGTFDVRLLVPAPIDGFSGRWLVGDGLVITAITYC